MNNRTPLYERHIALGGKIVDFAGWDMPVQYTTITQEHNAVRTAAGVFDISHMGQVMVWGPQAAAYLNFITTNDIEKAPLGKGLYAHFLNEKGGVIDDIFVYRLEEDRFLVIVNASRRDVDLAWMNSKKTGFSVDVLEVPYAAAIAVQGPKAAEILEKLSPEIPKLSRFTISEVVVGDLTVHAARTGYTGEDGFEIFAPAGHLLPVFDQLMQTGKTWGFLPCGLGARDTLRTEVAYPLYGHELDENHTPLEAGLEWVVKWTKGDFVGRAALEKQKKTGIPNRLIGFRVETGGVARPGTQIFWKDKNVGTVASGTFSPTLQCSIGMAYVPGDVPAENAPLTFRQGAREMSGQSVKLPFYKNPVLTK